MNCDQYKPNLVAIDIMVALLRFLEMKQGESYLANVSNGLVNKKFDEKALTSMHKWQDVDVLFVASANIDF